MLKQKYHCQHYDGGALRMGLYVYGERPITELFAFLATDSDLLELATKETELANGERIQTTSHFQGVEIYVEAPLPRVFGYVDLLLVYPDTCLMLEVKPDLYDNVEERLSDQLPRYFAFLRNPNLRSNRPLVRQIGQVVSSRKTYLVSVTGDPHFPPALRKYLVQLAAESASSAGWASYGFFRRVLSQKGYTIEGEPPHIWAASRQ